MRYLTFFLIVFLKVNSSYAQWENLNTGIDDNLTGIVFLQNNGIACGELGIYYTSNGGDGASSWSRFQITDNTANALIYENTKFTHCYSKSLNTTSSATVYFSGQNTIDNTAVLLMVSLPSLTYQLRYTGVSNSKLNKIDYMYGVNRYIAVGDSGLILGFTDAALTAYNTGINENILSVKGNSSTAFEYGTEGKLKRGQLLDSTVHFVGQLSVPDVSIKDIFMPFSVGNDNFMYANYLGPASITNNTYHNIPLNANCVQTISTSYVLVGTDNGIYRAVYNTSNFQNTPLELQPNTLGFTINEIWKQTGSLYTYACGNNGVILRTSNDGGPTQPYVELTVNGGCYPVETTLSAITGSAVQANWYANNQLFHSGLAAFNYTFPEPGFYSIRVDVQNSEGGQHSVVKDIYLVTQPNVNKVVTISDAILCKQEIIQIQIAEAEPNVIYTLRKEGQPTSNYGESPVSTGGNLVFSSILIDQTGNFYIDAKSSLVDCSQRFSSGFLITVEHTEADFDTTPINAQRNEDIHFYQETTDAVSYDWQFGPNASASVSALPNPVTSFASVGQSTVVLDATSSNGCHDIVTTDGPYIYDLATTADTECFNLVNNGPDPQWTGIYNPFVAQIESIPDGFLSCGSYNEDTFESTIGNFKTLSGKKGGYLCRYTTNGILRWMVYTVVPAVSGTENYDNFYATAADSQGNIYIAGRSGGYLYDTAHHKINLYTYNPNGGGRYFLIKLNSNGEFLWRIQNDLMQFTKVIVDHNDNVIVSLEGSHLTVPIYKDGVGNVPSGILGQIVTNPISNFLIAKFSPNGAIIWDANIELSGPNKRNISDIEVDGQNNIYVMNNFSSHASFYSVGSDIPLLTYNPISAGSHHTQPALVKYDANGSFQWSMRTKNVTSDGNLASYIIVHDIDVDVDGTVYMTGNNSNTYNSPNNIYSEQIFENTDATVTTNSFGNFFVAKINSNGVCQWARGAVRSGDGYKLIKDENEVYAVGVAQTTADGPAIFSSPNGNTCNYTSGVSDYFMVVYDTEGNLKRLIKSGENGYTAALFYAFTGFFKKNDRFYLSKDLDFYNSPDAPYFYEFGVSTQCLSNNVGDIISFKEDCGILIYDATLSNPVNPSVAVSGLSIVPNPTNNAFSIDLHQYCKSVIIQLYDVTGKLISEEKSNNINKFSSTITGDSGLYFVKLITEDQEKWFKLIKL